MQNSLYVNLSAQVALEKRLNTTANNVANMATAGFSRRGDQVLGAPRPGDKGAVAFVNSGDTFISRASARSPRPIRPSTWRSRAMPGSASAVPPVRSIPATGA